MQFYYKCEKILKKILESNKGYKYELFKYKDDSSFKKFYKIVVVIYKNKTIFSEIFEFLKSISASESINDSSKYLYYVLIYELFVSQRIKRMGGRLITQLKKYKNVIIPKYSLQLESLKHNEKYYFLTINDIKGNNFKAIFNDYCKENGIEYDLSTNSEVIRVGFEAYQKLFKKFELNNNPNIIIQSYCSSLPVHLFYTYTKLNNINLDGKVIIDCCSAPGNKTLQLLNLFPNSKIIAIEKNKKRFELLEKRIMFYRETDVNNSRIILLNKDFFEVDIQKDIEDIYGEIGAAICDPSCSGSGMKENNDKYNITYTDDISTINQLKESYLTVYNGLKDDDKERINNLKEFQYNILTKLITHNIKYISYSTCSIFFEENEDLVDKLLLENNNLNVLPVGENNLIKFSNSNYSNFEKIKNNLITEKEYNNNVENCIRIHPFMNEGEGFFISLLKNN